MKKAVLALIPLFIIASYFPLNGQWARTYGGFSDEFAYSIQKTSDGGYIIAGCTNSFGSQGYDILVLKINSAGAMEWQHNYGGPADDCAYDIRQTSDGGYIVAGWTDSFGAGGHDVLVLRLDSSGNIRWQHASGGVADDFAYAIQQTQDSGFIVAGETRSFGAGEADFWLLKLHPGGAVEWQRTYGGNLSDGARSIQQTIDRGYIVAGYTLSFQPATATTNIWVLKLTSSGAIEWQRAYGGENYENAFSIQEVITETGEGYIVAGETRLADNTDVLVIKIDRDGDVEWERAYGGNGDDSAYSIQQTVDEGYIIVGSTFSFSHDPLFADIWALKLMDLGNVQWERTYGEMLEDRAYSIRQTSDGGYILAGFTDVEGWPGYIGASGHDFMILKLSSQGDIHRTCGFIGFSEAVLTDTSLSLLDTVAELQNTNIVPSATPIVPVDTFPLSYLICEVPKYVLVLSATDGGTTVPAPGVHTYDENTALKITASPDKGYKFISWSGDALGMENPLEVVMDGNKFIKARFVPLPDESDKYECFIATAAFGSELDARVKVLREFRDQYLLRSPEGRLFICLYYRYSPCIASLIEKHKALKAAVRAALLPLVAFSQAMLCLGPAMTSILAAVILWLPIFAFLIIRKKIKRAKAKVSIFFSVKAYDDKSQL